MNKELTALFSQMLAKNKNRIWAVCRVYANNDNDETKDLFQEVLLNAWKSLPNFKGAANIDTWVYRIALNVCLQVKLSNSKSPPMANLDNVIAIHQEETSSEKQALYKALYSCISKLNDIEKSIVLMYLEELPYKEMADITGLTENHIAVKMARIKKQLFNCLNN